MTRPLTGALLLCVAQLSPLAPLAPLAFAQAPAALPAITLDAAQQATLGVRTTPVVPAGQQQLLASATVTVPPGQEVTVAAPMAGVIARLDIGLGDTVRAGAPLALLGSPQLADTRRQLREAELEARNRSSSAA